MSFGHLIADFGHPNIHCVMQWDEKEFDIQFTPNMYFGCPILRSWLKPWLGNTFRSTVDVHVNINYRKSTSIRHFEQCNQQLSNLVCQKCDGSIKIYAGCRKPATCSVIIIHSSR